MFSNLLRALHVFIRALLGTASDEALPEPTQLIPTVAERFGKPLPHPFFELETPLSVDRCLQTLRSTFGREKLGVHRADPRALNPPTLTTLRIRMTGRYRLPGPLQRQVLAGEMYPTGRKTRVVFRLAPRTENAEVAQLLSAIAIAAIVSFVFLTWLTGPSDVSLLVVAAISLPIGAVAGALAQGLLNARGHMKERRRLTRTADRLATLLDGTVVRWP